MAALAQALGLSPQAYYQALARERAQAEQETRILSLVRQVRARHPRMGGRKLLHLLRPMLAQEGLSIGRDRFFALLRRAGLLVAPRRNPQRTTWRGLYRYPNRMAGRTVTAPNQVWVGDITYLRLEGGRFGYLFVLMDLFSRAVVGWALAPGLQAEYALEALEQALRTAGEGQVEGLIHHTDHGVQYTSRAYQARLAQVGIQASMGAVGNAYENAFAERLLGILKQEYGLEGPWADLAAARRATSEGLALYNHERPHGALNMAVPWAVYTGQAPAPEVLVKEVWTCKPRK